MSTIRVKRMVTAAMCMALGLVLPFLTGQIPQIGKMLSPMHIPVFLCGFLCGAPYGLLVGFVTPPLRGALFGMPVLFPSGTVMAFELATYGAASGYLYRRIGRRDFPTLYLVLIVSMVIGRLVWGLASLVVYGVQGNTFTWSLFLTGALFNALPGIILHLLVIPALVHTLERAGFGQNK